MEWLLTSEEQELLHWLTKQYSPIKLHVISMVYGGKSYRPLLSLLDFGYVDIVGEDITVRWEKFFLGDEEDA